MNFLSAGLYYYRARYYDPEIGRFLSEDPLGFGAGINFYAYVENNPVNHNDPSGECATLCLGLITGGGAAIATAVGGGSRSDVALAFGAGFVSGATLGFGTGFLAGATALNGSAALAAGANVAASATSAAAANALTQGGQIYLTGSRDSFSARDVAISGVLGAAGGAPKALLAAGQARAIGSFASESLDLSNSLVAQAHTLSTAGRVGVQAIDRSIRIGAQEAGSLVSGLLTGAASGTGSTAGADGGGALYPSSTQNSPTSSAYCIKGPC